ncbi:MAG: serine hydrolase [Chloroflexota bacterium]
MSSLSGLGTNSKKRRAATPVIPIVSAFALAASLGLFVMELLRFSQQQTRLPSDISVAGIEVGGLTAGEAVARWEEVYAQPITLYYDESPILLDPAAVGFRMNNDVMLAQARATDNTGGSFWGRFLNHLTQTEAVGGMDIELQADYQQSLLRDLLVDIAARYDQAAGGAAYNLETLEVRNGGAGLQLDVNIALRDIEGALFNGVDRTVNLPVGQTSSFNANINTLRDLIISYLDSEGFIHDGQTTTASVYILDLQTGEEVNILGDVAYSAASVQKISIVTEYYRRLVFAPSEGEAWLMVNSLLCSNNSSSNLLMQIIGNDNLFAGLERINQTLQYLGARNSYITAPFDLGIQGQQLGSIGAPPTSPNPDHNTGADPFNRTTAEDMGLLYTLIYDCANYGSGLMVAYPEDFTRNECQQMLEIMSANDLLRLLQGGIPADVRISHKNGWIFDTVGDAGIVYSPNGRHYVISVFLWEETEFQDFERLWPLLEGISRASWNYFNPEAPLTEPRDDLPFTAQECEGNYLPPSAEETNLDDIDAWKTQS